MREKVKLSDLNILFVCLDQGHSTTVQRVLADVITFRNLGGNPLIFCRKDSFLDKSLEHESIARHHLLHGGGWRSALVLFQLVRQLIKNGRLDLVHCYNYLPLLVLGGALKHETKIPLIYTTNEEITTLYKPFWHDYFVTRVDQVLCFSPALGDRVVEILPLANRKVGFLGAGLELPKQASILPAHDNTWRICAYVPPDEEDTKRYLPLFMSLPLLEEIEPNKKVILTFATEGSWYGHPLYEQFKRQVLEHGLEHHVSFHPKPWGGKTLDGQHLFVAIPGDAPFESHELEALLHQVPVLLPRTSARTHLLRGGTLGLTYQPGDVRELRVKARELLENQEQFRAAQAAALPDLKEKHHFDRYIHELFQLYERLVLQRLRFSLKHRGFFASKA